MKKAVRFIAPTFASVAYFIIFIILKYSLHKILDWESALIGAAVFWIIILLVHQFIIKRTESEI